MFALKDCPMAAKKPYFLMTDFSIWEMPILPMSPSLRGVMGKVKVRPPRSTVIWRVRPALFCMISRNV